MSLQCRAVCASPSASSLGVCEYCTDHTSGIVDAASSRVRPPAGAWLPASSLPPCCIAAAHSSLPPCCIAAAHTHTVLSRLPEEEKRVRGTCFVCLGRLTIHVYYPYYPHCLLLLLWSLCVHSTAHRAFLSRERSCSSSYSLSAAKRAYSSTLHAAPAEAGGQ